MRTAQLAYVGYLTFVVAVSWALVAALHEVVRDTVHAVEKVIL